MIPETTEKDNMTDDKAPLTLVQQLAADLRAVADIVERLPPEGYADPSIRVSYTGSDAREKVVQAARVMGTVKKDFGPSWFSLDKRIGMVRLSIMTSRETVCRRIEEVVEEPEQIIPAQEEQVIPATKRTVVRWECPDSLLSEAQEP